MPSRFPVTLTCNRQPRQGPSSCANKAITFAKSTERCKQQSHRQVGHVIGQDVWRRRYAHASPARLVEIYGVRTNAVDGNDFQCRHAVHELAGKPKHAACRNCSYPVGDGLKNASRSDAAKRRCTSHISARDFSVRSSMACIRRRSGFIAQHSLANWVRSVA